MEKKFARNNFGRAKLRETWRFMKCFVLFLFLVVSGMASTYSQNVRFTFSLENVALTEVFSQIRQQSDYTFIFNTDDVRDVKVKSLQVTDMSIEEVLSVALKGTSFTFRIEDGIVVIQMKDEEKKFHAAVVSGKVVDEKKHPLPGVTVLLKGTTHGVVTNTNGVFTIVIPDTTANAELVLSFVGMKTKTVAYKDKPKEGEWIITMKNDVMQMEDVVVTGYTTLSRRESASAVTQIRAKDVMMSGVGSIDKMLQGRIPGMMVINTSGEPSATPKIRIRGNATINGNKSPVWVVDGVILEQDVPFTASDINSEDAEYLIGNAISGLNPQDIETITVLKDASATAIYGVKAANGVIVITTKRGKSGPPVITYNGDMTITTRPSYRNYDRMNSQQRMQLSKEIVEAGLDYPRVPSGDSYEGALEELYSKTITQSEFEEKIRVMQERNMDWFKELFRPSVNHSHSVSVSGGGEGANYYFSAGYNKEAGAQKESDSERFNALSKVFVNVNSWLNFEAKIDFSTTTNKGYRAGVNPFDYAYKTSRTLPAFNEDGSYHMYNRSSSTSSIYYYNFLKELEETGEESKINDFNALLSLNVNLLPGLRYQGVFSYSISNTEQRSWATEESYEITSLRGYNYKEFDETSEEYTESVLPYGGILDMTSTRKNGYTVRNQLVFARNFADYHDVNVMGGVEVRATRYKGHAVTGYGWTPEFGEKFMPVYTERFISNYVENGRLNPTNTNTVTQVASFYGTASYTFDNRYVINGNIRSDGANKFGSNPKYRWLPTWSVAGKWILSNESFMASNWIDELAIRGSYGIQGNIHDDATPNLIVQVGERDGTSNLDQYSIVRLPNPDLRWEKTKTWNVAVDFGFFRGRLRGGLDFYKKKTSDLIMSKSVATSNGRASLYMNAGKMRNSGFEGFLNIGILDMEDWDWRFNVNFGRNVNEIELANGDAYTSIDEVEMLLAGEVAVEGAPIGSIYSYHFAGLSHDNGYPLFYALDGRKVHIGEPVMMELVNSGSIFPKVSGGFDTQVTFKRQISLSLAFTYNVGNVQRLPSVYEDKYNVFDPLTNVSTKLMRRWKQPGDELYTNIPVLYDSDVVGDFVRDPNLYAMREGLTSYETPTELYDASSVQVAKGDFLKLKIVALSYMMPASVLKKLKLSSLTVRLQATNLFTIADKKWEGVDPEAPSANIPVLPTYSLGVNVSF